MSALDKELKGWVEASNLDEARHAIDQGADVDFQDGICLRIACDHGDFEMAELLIEHHADVNLQGGKPLEWAAKNGDIRIATLLIAKGANLHANKEAALRAAIMNQQLEIVMLLAGHQPDWAARDHDLLRVANDGATHAMGIRMPTEKPVAQEILALFVGQCKKTSIEKTSALYGQIMEDFRNDARKMAGFRPETKRRRLIDKEGEATTQLRQFAFAGVLDILFEPWVWKDPGKARAFYNEVREALPDYLKPAANKIDMTPFREEALRSPIPFATRAPKLGAVER